jgi:hypothetical protein
MQSQTKINSSEGIDCWLKAMAKRLGTITLRLYRTRKRFCHGKKQKNEKIDLYKEIGFSVFEQINRLWTLRGCEPTYEI